MRLLLDTHAFLWAVSAPAKLEASTARAIERAQLVCVSAASIWEVGIKRAAGRLRAPWPLDDVVARSGFTMLDITMDHATAAADLPLHHADPFDRMLIAQAHTERLTLVTRDEQLAAYRVPILAA